MVVLFSSCASLIHMKEEPTEHQKTKPTTGEPKRVIRPAEFTLNLLFCVPCIAVDLLTHKIYYPEPDPDKLKK